jgi:hypothetical protein
MDLSELSSLTILPKRDQGKNSLKICSGDTRLAFMQIICQIKSAQRHAGNSKIWHDLICCTR